MTWLFFLALNIITFSFTTILQRVLVKESSSKPIAYSIFFQLFTGIFVTVLALMLRVIQFPKLTLSLSMYLVLGTFLYAFANLFIFKALKITEASKFTVIFSSRAFFTILASTILLGEFLTLKQSLGAVFIFIGIALVNLKTRRLVITKGDLYAFIAAVLFGFANTNARYVLHSFTIFPYMIYVFFAPSLLLSLIYPREVAQIKIFTNSKTLMKALLLSVIYGLANIGFFEALKFGPSSSLVTTIQLFSVIITVALSILFLKERTNLIQKVAGTIISFIGLLLLFI